jgi:hypothetical protein
MVTGVSIEEVVEMYPRLYHMAAAGSWCGILRHGLLSTTALLDLFEINGSDRDRIESQHRPGSETIQHHKHGLAIIRDQRPMNDAGLVRALTDGLKPSDWYQILNRKVFFWLTPNRLQTLVNARAYKDERKTVIVLDTRKLLHRPSNRVLLSPMNSGCTKPYPHPRGRDTFKPLPEYPFAERRRKGLEPIVELAVDYLVSDVGEMVLSVDEVGGGSSQVRLFPWGISLEILKTIGMLPRPTEER